VLGFLRFGRWGLRSLGGGGLRALFRFRWQGRVRRRLIRLCGGSGSSGQDRKNKKRQKETTHTVILRPLACESQGQAWGGAIIGLTPTGPKGNFGLSCRPRPSHIENKFPHIALDEIFIVSPAISFAGKKLFAGNKIVVKFCPCILVRPRRRAGVTHNVLAPRSFRSEVPGNGRSGPSSLFLGSTINNRQAS
jgi:hypothetical protein